MWYVKFRHTHVLGIKPDVLQFYAHERGFYIGLYGMALFTSNFVAPIWAGVSVLRSILDVFADARSS